MIKLTRPLAVLDIETTGTNVDEDRIVEIAITKLFPDGSRESKSRRVNPGRPIPKEASDVHKITDEMVVDCPPFAQIAKGIIAFLEDCDLAGFNSNSFDFPFLYAEFNRAGIDWDYNKSLMIDAGNLFKILEPRTLSAAVMFYLGRTLDDAHEAQADVDATLDVLLTQMDKHAGEEGFPTTLEELALFSNFGKRRADISGKFAYNDAGELIVNFGAKHKGELAKNVPSYLQWMIKANFPKDSVAICKQILAAK